MRELLRETTDLSSHNRDAPEEELIMAAIDTYDAVVLGSGEAGKSIAWHLGGTGKRVAVVEQRYVGGSCPSVSCWSHSGPRNA
jgi:glycerol-3-phosphate dehydrogenase